MNMSVETDLYQILWNCTRSVVPPAESVIDGGTIIVRQAARPEM